MPMTKEELIRLQDDFHKASLLKVEAARATRQPHLWRWWMHFRGCDTRPSNAAEILEYEIATALYDAAKERYYDAIEEFAKENQR